LQLSRLLEDEDETRRPRNAIVLSQKENKAWLNDIRRAKGSWAATQKTKLDFRFQNKLEFLKDCSTFKQVILVKCTLIKQISWNF